MKPICHTYYVSTQKMYTIVETCASTQNVYNQNVKKSINTYVLQSLQIVILKEHETKSM